MEAFEEMILGIYSVTNTGWRGESVSSGLPLWLPIGLMAAVLIYTCVLLMLRRSLNRFVPTGIMGAVMALIVADYVVARHRDGAVGVGWAAALLACSLGLGIYLVGYLKQRRTEQVGDGDA